MSSEMQAQAKATNDGPNTVFSDNPAPWKQTSPERHGKAADDEPTSNSSNNTPFHAVL